MLESQRRYEEMVLRDMNGELGRELGCALRVEITRQTFIQRMYARWRVMSQLDEFWNLGDSYMLGRFRESDLHVPAEFASDGVLTEAMVISRRSFDRPVTVKNGEEVSVQFEFEIKDPTCVHEPEGAAMFGYLPQPPSEPEIICPCCKGSGTYTGFIKVEPCGECKGTGKVKGSPPKPADQPGAKGSPDIDYSALGLMSRQDREFS